MISHLNSGHALKISCELRYLYPGTKVERPINTAAVTRALLVHLGQMMKTSAFADCVLQVSQSLPYNRIPADERQRVPSASRSPR